MKETGFKALESAESVVTGLDVTQNVQVVEIDKPVDADYWTIEGMRAQEFSVGVFFFMLAGVAVFVGIIIRFMISDKKTPMKTGEKVMFIWIILGVIGAVMFGASQLLHGYLF